MPFDMAPDAPPSTDPQLTRIRFSSALHRSQACSFAVVRQRDGAYGTWSAQSSSATGPRSHDIPISCRFEDCPSTRPLRLRTTSA